jgi:O-antigen ligase
MNLTAGVWGLIAGVLVLLAVRRPAWAAAFYMQTFFAAPQLWWWGSDVPDLRYALWAGVIFLVSVLLHTTTRSAGDVGRRFTVVHYAAIAMVVNAAIVHVLFAASPTFSLNQYVEMLKFTLLFFLLWSGIQNKGDLRIVLVAIALGAGYIGYEVTINDRGDFRGSRLEGVGAPGADSSNGLACLLLTVLPLIGALLADSKRREKLLVLVTAPLVLNVVLLCNSRGAFLGLLGAAVAFVAMARGATRKRAIRTLLIGGVALYFLLGDPEIFDRFKTTFVGDQERDRSAASRLEFWQAGLLMLGDHPLGAGGGGFKEAYGRNYISRVIGGEAVDRSLHNGYLTEATDWGVQGLFLKLLFLGGAAVAAYKTSKSCRIRGDSEGALVGISIIVAAAGFAVTTMFGSFLNNEWAYWVAALLVRYSELYCEELSAAGTPASTTEVSQAAA